MSKWFFSKQRLDWVSLDKCELVFVRPSDKKVKGLTYTPGKYYYFCSETGEYLKDSYRIKYACETCGKPLELYIAKFDKKKDFFCWSCKQTIISNREDVKLRKAQSVRDRSDESRLKHSLIMKSKEVNDKRVKKFVLAVSQQSKERKKEIANKKRQAWNNKSEEEWQEIFVKMFKKGTTCKRFQTKYGEIWTQGFEDSVLIELLNLDGIEFIGRGHKIVLPDKNHFPDFEIRYKSQKILLEVKGGYLYKRYRKEILKRKRQVEKMKICDRYILLVLDKREDAQKILSEALDTI
jgi:uncharacterized Zn finger protein (UPF0148 family)